ncbi:RloB family protein [Pedobacter sp. GR22-10]|uniref:RloB family protein n=1 Tax=Pedobacter sp. GR22-10 TaxID=2994472 RepID=UPI0022465EB5|nr:RloB family protein [Pedobacter sp. GR22-10]MCX2429618.1 RloB family protein [Pedobacter sp. GR22-10]
MARIIKIDNAIKKQFARREKMRGVETRIRRLYFLIVCEGEKTEPNYFNQLSKSLPRGAVEVTMDIEGAARNTNSLVEYAEKYRKNSTVKYDRVWVVFDKDSFSDKNFNNAIQNALNNGFKTAWTNEAFELWFLLHFQYVNHSMDRKNYQGFLEREVERITGKKYKYKKNDPNMHSFLLLHGNQKQASQWAEKLIKNFSDNKYATHNPSTRVHHLIEELQNPEKVWDEINAF